MCKRQLIDDSFSSMFLTLYPSLFLSVKNKYTFKFTKISSFFGSYFLLKIYFIDVLQRGRERDRELETSMRKNHRSAAFYTPPTGDVPATKVHALDRNWTRDPSVCRPMLYPLSKSDRAKKVFYNTKRFILQFPCVDIKFLGTRSLLLWNFLLIAYFKRTKCKERITQDLFSLVEKGF